MDGFLTPQSRNIGDSYSCFIIYGIGLFLVGLLFHFFSIFVFWNTLAKKWWSGGMWWLFILPPLVFLAIITTTTCFFKFKEDKSTQARNFQVYIACKRAQELYLRDTNIHLTSGAYGAWIEVITGLTNSKKKVKNFIGNMSQQASNKEMSQVNRPSPQRNEIQVEIAQQRSYNPSYDKSTNLYNSPARSYQPEPPKNMGSPKRYSETVFQENDNPEYYNANTTAKKPLNNRSFLDEDDILVDSIKQERSKVFQEIKRRNYRREAMEKSGIYKSQFKERSKSRDRHRNEQENRNRREEKRDGTDRSWMKRNNPTKLSRSPVSRVKVDYDMKQSILNRFDERNNNGKWRRNGKRNGNVNVAYSSKVPQQQDDLQVFDPYL